LPVVGRTRKQLETAVGYNLGAVTEGTTTTAGGDTSSVIDTSLRGSLGSNGHNGKWLVFTSGDSSGEITKVTNTALDTPAANDVDLTILPVASASVASGVTYELWDTDFPPARIRNLMNTAILSVVKQYYDPVESVALHGDGVDYRLDVPSGIEIINKIEHRSRFGSTKIHSCNVAFDEITSPNFTQVVDSEDKKEGGSSLKVTVATGASAGDKITDSITSLNISKYDTVEFWAKCSITTTAGQLQILLDDTAACATPIETLAVPALTANTWTYCRVSLANPESDTAIISVGLKYTSDIGAATIWLDDIKAVESSTALWTRLPSHNWKIDKEARDLVLSAEGRNRVGYRLLKLVGGDTPALLTADSTTNEVPDDYVIFKTTALALAANAGGQGTDPDASRQRWQMWEALAENSRRSFPFIINGRSVS
jgi:hypothetical protein